MRLYYSRLSDRIKGYSSLQVLVTVYSVPVALIPDLEHPGTAPLRPRAFLYLYNLHATGSWRGEPAMWWWAL
jgi:hypothetical protein